jgi:hypothetical protein
VFIVSLIFSFAKEDKSKFFHMEPHTRAFMDLAADVNFLVSFFSIDLTCPDVPLSERHFFDFF